jgi:predicted acylesterase/phospholipase RssA
MRGCIQAKSQVRIDTEEWLARGTVDNPVTAAQIAEATGHPVMLVRAHISNAITRNDAHNLRAGHHGVAGLYVAGPASKPEVPNMPAPRTAPPSGRYEPAPWMPPRGEASMLAFRLPSVELGQRRDRTPPASMSGRALEAVMRGGVS